MRAIALLCPRCSGRLLASHGVSLGVCNPCSTAWDFSSGEKRGMPVEEPLSGPAGDDAGSLRVPFLRFQAAGGGAAAHVYVMAFAVSRIGSVHDDGAKLTADGYDGGLRPGRLDVAPELGVATGAGLARFLALRRLDPDGSARLSPAAIRLGAPAILAVPLQDRGDRWVNPITGVVHEKVLPDRDRRS